MAVWQINKSKCWNVMTFDSCWHNKNFNCVYCSFIYFHICVCSYKSSDYVKGTICGCGSYFELRNQFELATGYPAPDKSIAIDKLIDNYFFIPRTSESLVNWKEWKTAYHKKTLLLSFLTHMILFLLWVISPIHTFVNIPALI